MEATVKATLNNIIRAISYIYIHVTVWICLCTALTSTNSRTRCTIYQSPIHTRHNGAAMQGIGPPVGCNWRSLSSPRTPQNMYRRRWAGENSQPWDWWSRSTIWTTACLKKSYSELYVTSELQFITEYKPTKDMCFKFNLTYFIHIYLFSMLFCFY